jgi:isocitrate dehydrogenase kinase/phosphatase
VSERAADPSASAATLAPDACVDTDAVAAALLRIFDAFYCDLCALPGAAQSAFERCDTAAAVRVSRERLALWSGRVLEAGPRLRARWPVLASEPQLWEAVERSFVALIALRYEADIAFSFAHSLRRNVCQGLWRPVAYSFPPPSPERVHSMAALHRRLPLAHGFDLDCAQALLDAAGLRTPFADRAADCQRILQRLEAIEARGPRTRALDIVQAGFFRERMAVVVARRVLEGGGHAPVVLVLVNGPAGVRVDALLERTADVHNLFSSALANFHLASPLYYQACAFLHSIMPLRPFGHHYATIGYNHVGKVAILEEIADQLRKNGQRLDRSPGAAGTVALGFTCDACTYHLKVVRDRPTSAYKWGHFPGREAVLEKYRLAHEMNRAGSMLDSVLYFNLRLPRTLFEPALLEEVLAEAGESVQLDGEDGVIFRHLVVQLKIVPLPVYLETADEEATAQAMVELGACIRNNAATNVFNRDLDARNYGVGRYGRVLLFDYDAIEHLTDVKLRSNADREPGEESVPDWFFEKGVVFLPEELESGLRLRQEPARREFRQRHGDLLTLPEWQRLQGLLLAGEHPPLRSYPETSRL